MIIAIIFITLIACSVGLLAWAICGAVDATKDINKAYEEERVLHLQWSEAVGKYWFGGK